jgi:DNA-directed RNA polymerase subunit H (RpoH/RPB5)
MAEVTQTSINHVLAPKCTICTEEQVKNLLSKYNIRKDQLPKISEKDPSIINLALESGTILMFNRSSKTEPNSKFYRVVV